MTEPQQPATTAGRETLSDRNAAAYEGERYAEARRGGRVMRASAYAYQYRFIPGALTNPTTTPGRALPAERAHGLPAPLWTQARRCARPGLSLFRFR